MITPAIFVISASILHKQGPETDLESTQKSVMHCERVYEYIL